VRDSTGVVTAKLLAEKNNPQADVVLGVAASSLALLSQEGMLLPYAPTGFKDLNPAYSDTARPPAWVGMDVWGATVWLQYHRSQKTEPAETGNLERSGQADLQRPDRDATSGFKRHRLSRCHRLVADVW